MGSKVRSKSERNRSRRRKTNAHDDVTNIAVQSKPGVSSWRYIRVGNAFQVCRNMETDAEYGWGTSGTGIDTHLMKNVEWGAVAYLSEAIRDGEEIWINNYTEYNGSKYNALTGVSSSSSKSTGSTTNLADCKTYAQDLNTANNYYSDGGAKASTTGNIYGIYDMSGGAWEYVSAYIANGHSNITTYGLTMSQAENAKYVDVYTASEFDINHTTYTKEHAEEATLGNYENWATRYGDALYETSYQVAWNTINPDKWYYYTGGQTAGSGGTGDTRKYGWYSDFSLGGWGSKRFFLRGGQFSNSTGAGAFAFDCINGYPYYHSGFRPVVVLSKN